MSSLDFPAPSSASDSAKQHADAAADDDLDPAAFLKSVRELSEKREREDAERYRKLEEEVEKSRRERRERRAERARSISPEKARPHDTTVSKPLQLATASPAAAAMDPTPAPESPTKDIPVFKGFASSSKPRTQPANGASTLSEPSTAPIPSRTASSLARSGTLSWQQRPSSRGAGSRPKSMIVPEVLRPAPTTSGATTDDIEPSRDQIAASLGSRDPSWFRQTADRGQGNAAYRKSKDESVTGDNVVSGRRGLPGMSRESSTEPSYGGSPARSESVTSGVTSRTGSVRGYAASSTAFSTVRTSTSSKPDLKSLIAADQEQEKLSPRSERTTSATDEDHGVVNRTLTMSSSQARLGSAAERPPSPTKGMGGFVQSAMMKRSDSVSKRWSAQPGPSLSRENSLTGASSAYGGLTGSSSMPKLEPTVSNLVANGEASSSSDVSTSNLSNTSLAQSKEDRDVFVKPALPSTHSRSKSITSSYSTTAEEGHAFPSSSPTKRWSPSKSSWLESAITKPESKPLPAARNSQPSWMADIAKAKAQRASVDMTSQPAEDPNSRPGSPTKAPFGQGILKRSESRDAMTPRSLTPKPLDAARSRSASPTKSSSGQGFINRSESRDLVSGPSTPVVQPLKDVSVAKRADEVQTKAQVNDETRDEPAQTSSLQPAPLARPVVLPVVAKSPLPTTTKTKPETPPKPQTDFRSTLRPRAPTDTKQPETPEFFSKVGNLRKAQTQNYVAPDVLKDNILRGKGELAKTGGPVKTQRRDELKESLLAKKEQIKKEKEEGIVHERKISNPPQTPQKPEALVKRELLGRSEAVKSPPASPEKPKTATPEALVRLKSLREKSRPESTLPGLYKQTSAPESSVLANRQPIEPTQPAETSKIAAKFNPGLASILARGPPSNEPARTNSPSISGRTVTQVATPPSEPVAEGGALQDMRKGRAKGPKRRKAGAASEAPETTVTQESEPPSLSGLKTESPAPLMPSQPEDLPPLAAKPKPRALPGSAASLTVASLGRSSPKPQQVETPSTPSRFSAVADNKPSIPAKSPLIGSPRQTNNMIPTPVKSTSSHPETAQQLPTTSATKDIPEFQGFRSAAKTAPTMRLVEDVKENAGDGSPSVKAAASKWGKPSSPKKDAMPGQIDLPSRKDEEAAMRSAGLLSSSPSRPGSSGGMGITSSGSTGSTGSAGRTIKPTSSTTNAPPRPNKPSRAVSGQLQEASSNQGLDEHVNAERRLAEAFGSTPRYSGPLAVDVQALISSSAHQERVFKTCKKTVYVATEDGTLQQLQPQEDYTFFDHCVYACHHAYTTAGGGPKKHEILVWIGSSSPAGIADQAQTNVKKMAKEASNAFVHTVRQGMEPSGFLQALGGILITRRGQPNASKQYMLCGRKHLGQIVFDEVDFGTDSLSSGYAFLVSHPITLQETKLYLWKGSACSPEELSAARLASMDLNETGAIEVDEGVEFASFLKVFGHSTTKASIPSSTPLWQAKAISPASFSCRLFSVKPEEAKAGIFGGMFARRPSSPSRRPPDVKVTAQEVSPFTQSDLDVDGLYILDAHSHLYILVGPMFASQPEATRNAVFGQAVLCAREYTVLAASLEDRPAVPRCSVLLNGVPLDVKVLFRHWDEQAGLWGTAGLMAGSRRQDQVEMLGLEEVLRVLWSD